MSSTKRATVNVEAPLYRALRLKSAATGASVSELVNAAVRQSLADDADDLAAFRGRAKEPRVSLKSVVRDLKRRGRRD